MPRPPCLAVPAHPQQSRRVHHTRPALHHLRRPTTPSPIQTRLPHTKTAHTRTHIHAHTHTGAHTQLQPHHHVHNHAVRATDFLAPPAAASLQLQPAKDHPPLPPEQLHVRHQGAAARGGPVGAVAAEAARGALPGARHAPHVRGHPRLPRAQPPAHPDAADCKRLLQAVRALSLL